VALGFPLEETRVYWNSAMSKLLES
jgi:hypothetical protein